MLIPVHGNEYSRILQKGGEKCGEEEAVLCTGVKCIFVTSARKALLSEGNP
jgi:hypothetical protein